MSAETASGHVGVGEVLGMGFVSVASFVGISANNAPAFADAPSAAVRYVDMPSAALDAPVVVRVKEGVELAPQDNGDGCPDGSHLVGYVQGMPVCSSDTPPPTSSPYTAPPQESTTPTTTKNTQPSGSTTPASVKPKPGNNTTSTENPDPDQDGVLGDADYDSTSPGSLDGVAKATADGINTDPNTAEGKQNLDILLAVAYTPEEVAKMQAQFANFGLIVLQATTTTEATEAPTTAEPATEAPTTAEPTTDAPTTAEPTTGAVETDPQTTKASEVVIASSSIDKQTTSSEQAVALPTTTAANKKDGSNALGKGLGALGAIVLTTGAIALVRRRNNSPKQNTPNNSGPLGQPRPIGTRIKGAQTPSASFRVKHHR